MARVDLTPTVARAWTKPLVVPGSPTDLAVGFGFIWVLDASAGEVERWGLDGQFRGTIPASGDTHIALGGGSAWLADQTHRRLVRLDPSSLKTDAHPLTFPPGDLVFLDGLLWVIDVYPGANAVWPIDPVTGHRGGSIKVGNGPHELATTPSSIWVRNSESVTRIFASGIPPLNITDLPGPVIGIAADPASPANLPSVWLLIAAPASSSSASPSTS